MGTSESTPSPAESPPYRALTLAHITDPHLQLDPPFYRDLLNPLEDDSTEEDPVNGDDDATHPTWPRRAHLTVHYQDRSIFDPRFFRAALSDLSSDSGPVGHVICTGDVVLLGLEEEYMFARREFVTGWSSLGERDAMGEEEGEREGEGEGRIHDDAQLCVDLGKRFSFVPGNHDFYFVDPFDQIQLNAFGKVFRDTLGRSLPLEERNLSANSPYADYPYIKLLPEPLDRILLIGFNSRIPREDNPPRGSKGEVRQEMIDDANRLLESYCQEIGEEQYGSLMKVVALHHNPVRRYWTESKESRVNLERVDRERVHQFCGRHRIALVLCGHTHDFHAEGISVSVPEESGDVLVHHTLCVDSGSVTDLGVNWFVRRLPTFTVFELIEVGDRLVVSEFVLKKWNHQRDQFCVHLRYSWNQDSGELQKIV